MRFFLVAEILLLCAAFVMLTVWATLLRYPARLSSPASWLFVHVPVRMFLLFLINLAIWQNGLIALRWFKYNGTDPHQKPGKWEREHETHAWIAFGVITGLGLIDSFIVFLGKDLAWAAATIFLFVSILVKGEKPVQVVVRPFPRSSSTLRNFGLTRNCLPFDCNRRSRSSSWRACR